MKRIYEPMDLATLETPIVDDVMRQLYRLWNDRQARLCPEHTHLLEHCVLFSDDYYEDKVPEYLFVGAKSFAAKMAGDDWMLATVNERRLDPDYEKAGAKGYNQALKTNRPQLHSAYAEFYNPKQVPVRATYFRLILPIWVCDTTRLLLAYSQELDAGTLRPETADTQHLGEKPQSTKDRLGFPERAHPNGAH